MMCDITAYRGDVVCELPSVLCDHYAVQYGGKVSRTAWPLEDAPSAFADTAVCEHHGGWHNGEGAQGGIVRDDAYGRLSHTRHAAFIATPPSATHTCPHYPTL